MAEANLKAKITMDDSQYHAAIRRASMAAVNFSRSAGSAFSSISTVGLAAASAAALGSAAAMVSLTKAAIELGGQFNDLSQQTGAPVAKLALLSQAFDAAGIGGDQLGGTLNKLQKAIEAGDGAFEGLHLNLDLLKKLSPDEQLTEVGKAIANLRTPSEQTAKAMEIFGKSGGKLLGVFKDGGALENAKKVLGSMPEILQNNIEQFDNLGDSIDALPMKWKAFGVGLTSTTAPALQSVIDKIVNIDTAKIGMGLGKDLAAGFESGDVNKGIELVGAKFVRVMAAASSSAAQLLSASLLSGFKEPIATFQANITAAAALAGAAMRGENVEEITPKDRKYAKELQGEIADRQADLKTRSADYNSRKAQSPYYEGSDVGKRAKEDILLRKESIQAMTKAFTDLQTRINNSRQYDPVAIKEDLMSTGGGRMGFGEGETSEQIIARSLEDLKKALAADVPEAFAAANSEALNPLLAALKIGSLSSIIPSNLLKAVTDGATSTGRPSSTSLSSPTRSSLVPAMPAGSNPGLAVARLMPTGKITGARFDGSGTTSDVENHIEQNRGSKSAFSKLQAQPSAWDRLQGQAAAEKMAKVNPDMLDMAGFGAGNIARLAAGRVKPENDNDSVMREPSRKVGGVRKRGETKEEFRERIYGKGSDAKDKAKEENKTGMDIFNLLTKWDQ